MHKGSMVASKTPAFVSGLMAYSGEPQHTKPKRALSFELPETKLQRSSPDIHRGRHTCQSNTSLMKAALKLWSVCANKTRSSVEGCE